MGGVAGYLAGRAAFAPVVNQAAGRDAEVAPQCRMITQPQLLAEQGGLQLTVELAVQLLAAGEELRTLQVAVRDELALMQVFDIA